MPHSRSLALRIILSVFLGITGALIFARSLFGPFQLGIAVNSPINLESMFALAALLLLVVNTTQEHTLPVDGLTGISKADLPFAAAIVVIVVSAFWSSLSLPLISDDYVHIANVSKPSPTFIRDLFIVPAGDRFFRPLGMLTYLLDTHWAGFDPFRWHLSSLIVHVLNCLLLYQLAKLYTSDRFSAACGALIFGVHGSRPESVCWVAAKFDLLATFFTLLCLLTFIQYLRRSRALMLGISLAASFAALLSKEAAFVLPLLLTLFALHDRNNLVATLRRLTPFYVMSLIVFVYRWQLLGGIGGYETTTRQPTIFIFSFVRTAKAMLLRLWATLYFPINWNLAPEIYLSAALLCAIVAYIWLARNNSSRPSIALWLTFTLITALPVQHLLLISADLEKSRVLYLPSAGFAVLCAIALRSIARLPVRWAAAAGIVIIQLAALQHNIGIWGRVTETGRSNCQLIGARLKNNNDEIRITGLPNVLDGVYFLHNGFPQCVEMLTGVPERRVEVLSENQPETPSARQKFVWDATARRVVPVP